MDKPVPKTENATADADTRALTAREQRMIGAALSGRGRWRLYLISLALVLVVPLEGWEIGRRLWSAQSDGVTDYGVPIMIISIHVILWLKAKQRCDYLALIRKLCQ